MGAKRVKKMAAGKRLFRAFRVDEPDALESVLAEPLPEVGVLIGTLDTVEYTTVRGGKVEHYRHEFAEKSRPMLVSSETGSAIFIVGGDYKFTARGIVDH